MELLLNRDLLAIYLNDHLAGATAARDLARRAAGANAGSELGEVLGGLADEIDEDRRELETVMERLGIGKDRLKVTLGWGGEKLGRLKLNGRLRGYSPLSRLLELEGLLAGITAKRALWIALREIAASESALEEATLEELIARADRQLDALKPHHRRAAGVALAERGGNALS